MTKKEYAAQLRNCEEPHYNCAQAVAMPFAPEMKLPEEDVRRLLAHFGGGMGIGSTCGALTGALAALGAMGVEVDRREELAAQFKEQFGALDCATLTAGLERGTPEMKARCGAFISFAVDWLCREQGVEN